MNHETSQSASDAQPAEVAGQAGPAEPTPVGRGRFYTVMAVAALLIAGVLALFASAAPDGLERVAIDQGFADSAQDSAVAGSPLADYTLGGGEAEPSAGRSAAAGIAGVALMAAVAFGVFGLLGRRSSNPDQQ